MATRRLPRPLDREELRRIRRACRKRPEVWDLIVLLRETGLRSAEVLQLSVEEAKRWPRLSRRPVTVRIIGKGDKERLVVLTRQARAAARRLARAGRARTQLVPWSDRGMRYVLREVGEAAGVHLHPHRLRHTHISELVEAGVPIEVVADMVGHSRVDITRLYWTASARAKTAALRARRRYLRRGA